ncbi:hypothetical protein BJ912DRAFT_126603 [Pholiota molesta]|nr:hypothetical protein BJ912DRAFT_126603 [Pholiota molesta]
MLHSFVIAKLLPRLPAWSTHGQRVAASLVTKPFLALHLLRTPADEHVYRKSNVFIVTREKPSSPGSEYFVVNPSSKVNGSSLTVAPPLPVKGPLYLLITPRISAAFPDTKEYERLSKAERYQMDEASVNKFLKALKEAGPSAPAPRITGGDDEPAAKWETWSGETPREAPGAVSFGRYVDFSFDLLPFKSLPNDFETSVLDELPLVRQLTLDYTWEGCGLITKYIEDMREFLQDMPRRARIREDIPPA